MNTEEKKDAVIDLACELLSNVETDGCYYCVYGRNGYLFNKHGKICEFNCSNKEEVKKYLFNEVMKNDKNTSC